jgi:hypothetical protein
MKRALMAASVLAVFAGRSRKLLVSALPKPL